MKLRTTMVENQIQLAYLNLSLQWLHIVNDFVKHNCLASDLKKQTNSHEMNWNHYQQYRNENST